MASYPSAVQSPLLEEARNCYINRRKHSKRIKKLTRKVAKQEPARLNLRRIKSAPDGQQPEVLKVLANREIPQFLMDLVLRKRIFNIGSIKKMAISLTGDAVPFPSLSFMAEHCRKQEEELKQIVAENKHRFEESRRQAESLTLRRRATVAVVQEQDAHSSTMSLDSAQDNSQILPDYQSHSPDDDFHTQQPNMLDFNEPLDALESTHHQSIFMTMF